jgi:hypothetical protein
MSIDWNININFSRPVERKEKKEKKEKRQKLELKIKEEKKKQTKYRMKKYNHKKRVSIDMAEYNTQWLIIQKVVPWNINYIISMLKGTNYLQKQMSLSSKMSELFVKYNGATNRDFVLWYNQTQYATYNNVSILLNKNQRVRQLFKTLLTAWRIQRLRLANENDPITLSKPEIPITIYCFELGIKYVYDAETLARDIDKKLLNNDGMFPNPLFPKNTLTNVEYTMPQLLSIWHKCKKAGLTSWTFEAFRVVKFDIDKFLLYHNRILRVNAMRSVLKNSNDIDYYDTVYDFIMLHHDHHSIDPEELTYKRFILSYPDDPIILLWRSLCRKWYEASILIEDTGEKYEAMDKLYEKSKDLCMRQRELYTRMRNLNRVSR